jgi:hypothetical protein
MQLQECSSTLASCLYSFDDFKSKLGQLDVVSPNVADYSLKEMSIEIARVLAERRRFPAHLFLSLLYRLLRGICDLTGKVCVSLDDVTD